MKPEEKALSKFLELREARPFETHEDRLAIMREVVQEAVAEGEKSAEDRLDMLETAWGLIANVSGGDLSTQSSEWYSAMEAFREKYHDELKKALDSRKA